jgi:pimeloyl-ACP methyl ester carboxylesterase/class 3 adenylate cyclase
VTIPKIRYARSGSVHVAYTVSGSGPDLIWTPGSSSHLELDWESPYFRRVFDRLGTFCRLIVFDKRGTGLSDRSDLAATLEERIDDIKAVMDGARSERAHLWGFSDGGTMVALFAATYPERTRTLMLWGAKPRWTRTDDYPWGQGSFGSSDPAEYTRDPDFTTDYWRRWLGKARDDSAFLEFWARRRRSGGSPSARMALAAFNSQVDVRDVLPTIRVPTLVMGRVGDPVAEIEAVRDLAGRIPGATLVEFPGDGHNWSDIWEQVVSTIEEWVTGRAHAATQTRALFTILFADIVSSTERIARVGDAAWRTTLDRYRALVDRELPAHGGVLVDTAGDGLLARFDGPGRAIRCARALEEHARTLGLELRAGVHTGEVELAGNEIRGIAVHTAARVAALAGPGEVYTTSTVRDLVAGSGIDFADRGIHELKGVPGPRQILAVTAA